MNCALVICDVCHAEMCRYAIVDAHSSENQSATAFPLFASVMGSDGAYGGGGGDGGDGGDGGNDGGDGQVPQVTLQASHCPQQFCGHG